MAQNSSKPVLQGIPEEVGRYYDQMWQMEATRLETWSPVEYAMTLRYLRRFVPDGATVAEIGVGVGHYSEALARRGCRLCLVDVSQKLLDAAAARLTQRGLAQQIVSVTHGSATDLGFLASGNADAVLLLGPLYHLMSLEERQTAVAEAARVLKPGGILFAAGINRLTYLRDMFRRFDPCALLRLASHADASKFILSRLAWVIGARKMLAAMQGLFRRDLREGKVQEFVTTGRLDPEHAPPLGYGHMTTIAEFRNLFTDFQELALVGMESFTSPALAPMADVAAEDRERWLDLVEQTGATLEGLAYSDHFLYIGKK